MSDRIIEFKDEYSFLSNFYIVDIIYDFEIYRSTEHAYQAAKSLSNRYRKDIRDIIEPGNAKKFSRTIKKRKDWQDINLSIMEELNIQKFSKDPLRSKLLYTQGKELIEGNWCHDNFYGSCFCDRCGFHGRNELGKILMKIRMEMGLKNK
jgi:hypothetical protein